MNKLTEIALDDEEQVLVTRTSVLSLSALIT